MMSTTEQSQAYLHLKPIVEAHYPELLDTLESLCMRFEGPLTLKRKESLIEAGEDAHDVYFIIEGAIGRYTPNGHRLIFLSTGPSFILNEDVWTRRSERSTDHYIALNDITYYKLSAQDFDAFAEIPGAYELVQLASWRYLDERRSRLRELMHSSAEDRLKALTERHPGVLKWLTRNEIASYLGMSRANFYRLIK